MSWLKRVSSQCDCVYEEDRVGTCPICLPAGAITYLIENGRQLTLFEGPPEPIGFPGVDDVSEGGEPDESIPVKTRHLDDDLPF